MHETIVVVVVVVYQLLNISGGGPQSRRKPARGYPSLHHGQRQDTVRGFFGVHNFVTASIYFNVSHLI